MGRPLDCRGHSGRQAGAIGRRVSPVLPFALAASSRSVPARGWPGGPGVCPLPRNDPAGCRGLSILWGPDPASCPSTASVATAGAAGLRPAVAPVAAASASAVAPVAAASASSSARADHRAAVVAAAGACFAATRARTAAVDGGRGTSPPGRSAPDGDCSRSRGPCRARGGGDGGDCVRRRRRCASGAGTGSQGQAGSEAAALAALPRRCSPAPSPCTGDGDRPGALARRKAMIPTCHPSPPRSKRSRPPRAFASSAPALATPSTATETRVLVRGCPMASRCRRGGPTPSRRTRPGPCCPSCASGSRPDARRRSPQRRTASLWPEPASASASRRRCSRRRLALTRACSLERGTASYQGSIGRQSRPSSSDPAGRVPFQLLGAASSRQWPLWPNPRRSARRRPPAPRREHIEPPPAARAPRKATAPRGWRASAPHPGSPPPRAGHRLDGASAEELGHVVELATAAKFCQLYLDGQLRHCRLEVIAASWRPTTGHHGEPSEELAAIERVEDGHRGLDGERGHQWTRRHRLDGYPLEEPATGHRYFFGFGGWSELTALRSTAPSAGGVAPAVAAAAASSTSRAQTEGCPCAASSIALFSAGERQTTRCSLLFLSGLSLGRPIVIRAG